jgi:hypothetical protein
MKAGDLQANHPAILGNAFVHEVSLLRVRAAIGLFSIWLSLS